MKIILIFFDLVFSEGTKRFLVDDLGLTSAEKDIGYVNFSPEIWTPFFIELFLSLGCKNLFIIFFQKLLGKIRKSTFTIGLQLLDTFFNTFLIVISLF